MNTEKTLQKTTYYRDLSSTCFQIHPKQNYNINYREKLPLRPNCFSQRCFHIGKDHITQYQKSKQKIFTFKPQIHQLQYQLYPQQKQITKEHRFQRLIQNKRDKIRKLLEIKTIKDNLQFQECTFKPQIQKYLEQSYEDSSDVFDRLYNDAKEKKLFQHEVMSTLESPQQKNIPKKPILNSQKYNLQPIYCRLKQIFEKKLKDRKQLIQKNSQHYPFHPQINTKQHPYSNKSVVKRLMEQLSAKKKRQQQLTAKYQQIQNQKLTFKPLLNSYIQTGQNQFIKQLQDRNLEEMSLQSYQSCTFKPQINKMSQLIVKHSRGQEKQNEQVERLTNLNIQQRQQKLIKIFKQAYAECTFNPQINQISKQIHANHVSHCCQAPPQDVFTFKPMINQCSRLLAKNRKQPSKSLKQQKKQSLKHEQQYKKMKQCTFKPKINSKILQSNRQIVNVQGIYNFMEKIDRSNKKKQQQKQYQDKIFNFVKKYDKKRKQKSQQVTQFKINH